MKEDLAGLSFVVALVAAAIALPLEIHAVVIRALPVGAVVAFLVAGGSDFFRQLFKEAKKKPGHSIPENPNSERYLAIDCEMVGTGPNGKQSALARISIVNWELEVVFDTYVQVMDRVTDYRTPVSGIRAKHLKGKNAMNFRKCHQRVADLLAGKIVVGHGLENDFEALRLYHPEDQIRDTALYRPLQRFHNGKWRARKLRELVRDCVGKDDFQEGEHDSIQDARAVMELFHIFHGKWEDGTIAKD